MVKFDHMSLPVTDAGRDWYVANLGRWLLVAIPFVTQPTDPILDSLRLPYG